MSTTTTYAVDTLAQPGDTLTICTIRGTVTGRVAYGRATILGWQPQGQERILTVSVVRGDVTIDGLSLAAWVERQVPVLAEGQEPVQLQEPAPVAEVTEEQAAEERALLEAVARCRHWTYSQAPYRGESWECQGCGAFQPATVQATQGPVQEEAPVSEGPAREVTGLAVCTAHWTYDPAAWLGKAWKCEGCGRVTAGTVQADQEELGLAWTELHDQDDQEAAVELVEYLDELEQDELLQEGQEQELDALLDRATWTSWTTVHDLEEQAAGVELVEYLDELERDELGELQEDELDTFLGWACGCCAVALANADTSGCEYACRAGHVERLCSWGLEAGELAVPGDADDEHAGGYRCAGCGEDSYGSRLAVHHLSR